MNKTELTEANMGVGKKAIRVSFWFAFCSIVQKVIQVVTVPIFTRLLTTEQYGQYSLYQSWMSLISIFATLNLSAGVYNNALTRYENDRDRYTSSMLGLTTVTVTVTFSIYLMTADWWDTVFGLPRSVMFVMFAEMLFTAALNFWNVRQRFEFRYKALVAVTLCMAVLNPILSFIGISQTEERGVARIVSSASVNIAFGFLFYVLIMSRGKKLFVKEYWKYALAFNIPLIPHYLSQIVLAQSDRIMIDSMFGETEVAIYSVAYSIGFIMTIAVNAINASFVPWTYQSCKKEQFDSNGRIASILLIGIAGVSLIPILLGPEVITIMAPSEYSQAAWVIPPVALSTYFMFVNSLFGNIEFYYEANKFVMIASTLSGVSNIILNFVFMRLFGYIAAGYTTLVCYILLSMANYFYMMRIIKKRDIESKIYNIHAIVAISLALCGISGVCMALYPLPIVRYGIIAVAIVIAWKERKMIMERVWIARNGSFKEGFKDEGCSVFTSKRHK